MEGPCLDGKIGCRGMTWFPQRLGNAFTHANRETLAWVLRLILAGVFLYAGIIKSTASEQFFVALVPFTFLPEALLLPISQGLPIIEILVGILILIPKTHRLGAGLALALLLVFMTVLAWALTQGIIVSCSCFGENDAPSAWKMMLAIVRNLILGAVALWLVLRENLPRSVPPSTFLQNPNHL